MITHSKLALFGLSVLSEMEADCDWGSDLLERIKLRALDLGIAESSEDGMFRKKKEINEKS
jgi:hypothetical protein